MAGIAIVTGNGSPPHLCLISVTPDQRWVAVKFCNQDKLTLKENAVVGMEFWRIFRQWAGKHANRWLLIQNHLVDRLLSHHLFSSTLQICQHISIPLYSWDISVKLSIKRYSLISLDNLSCIYDPHASFPHILNVYLLFIESSTHWYIN